MSLEESAQLTIPVPFLRPTTQILGHILNDPLSEITLTLVVGYGCYVLSESTGANTSGVLAMVRRSTRETTTKCRYPKSGLA